MTNYVDTFAPLLAVSMPRHDFLQASFTNKPSVPCYFEIPGSPCQLQVWTRGWAVSGLWLAASSLSIKHRIPRFRIQVLSMGQGRVTSVAGIYCWKLPYTGLTHRPLSSSFLWFIFRILQGNPKKDLLRGLWVHSQPQKEASWLCRRSRIKSSTPCGRGWEGHHGKAFGFRVFPRIAKHQSPQAV